MAASRRARSDRRGFTLVELMVVSVLGALVVGAMYQVLVTQQRTYTAQNVAIQQQQAVRAGMDILFGELREVSISGQDILAMSSDSITVRTMRSFGLVCEVDYSGTVRLKIKKVGQWFQDGDSMLIFADKDSTLSGDDTFFVAVGQSRDTTETCTGTDQAQEMQFPSHNAEFVADTVRLGAPVRSFETFTYGLYEDGGESYLARRGSDGRLVPLVGPVRSSNGVEFEYLDSDGNATTTVTDVAQIVVTLRTISEARGPDGNPISDSITARIYPRN